MKFCLRNDLHPFHKKKTAQRAVFLIWSATTSKPTTPDTAVSNFLFLTLIIAK